MSIFQTISQKYQFWLDRTVPLVFQRWLFLGVLAMLYVVRVIWLQGWYIVTYALGIYLLNMFIAFLTPKVDPAFQRFEEEEDGPTLPTSQQEEFRPFIRRLPEFKFWNSAMKAFSIALFCTFFQAFNVPVFWPILLIYFVILFFATMNKQIRHMIKYRYIPFTRGKAKYAGKPEQPNNVPAGMAPATIVPQNLPAAPVSSSTPPPAAPPPATGQ